MMLNLTMDFYPIIQNDRAIGLIDKRDKTEYYFIKSIRKKTRHMLSSVIYRDKNYPIKCLNKFYLIFKHKNGISKILLDNTTYYITNKK